MQTLTLWRWDSLAMHSILGWPSARLTILYCACFTMRTFFFCIKDSRDHTLEFYSTTISEVGINGGFVIIGDVNTRYTVMDYDLTPAVDTAPLADGCECRSLLEFPSDLPVIILSARGAPLPAAKYGSRFTGVRSVPTFNWSVGSYCSSGLRVPPPHSRRWSPLPAHLLVRTPGGGSTVEPLHRRR